MPDTGPLIAGPVMERELRRPWHRVSFLDREVEATFRSTMLPVRKRHVTIEIVLLSLIALAVLPIDAQEHRYGQATVMLRLGVTFPFKVLALVLARTARTDLRLDIASALSFCTGFSVAVVLGLSAQPEIQQRYFSVLGAVVLLFGALTGQRTRSACLTVGFVVILLVLATDSLNPKAGYGLFRYAGFIAAFSLVALAIHVHLVERAARSFFLRVQFLAAKNAELDHRIGELDHLAKTDALTGLGNRRLMEDGLAAALERGRHRGRWVGLAILDVDHFKRFNDTAGHVAGDACLKGIAVCLSEAFPEDGVTVARLGGEEFALVVPDAAPETMLTIGERARAAVEAMAWAHPGRSDGACIVTISVGVASLIPGPGLQAADLLRAADTALYESKNRGRNAVTGRPALPLPAGPDPATERVSPQLAAAGSL